MPSNATFAAASGRPTKTIKIPYLASSSITPDATWISCYAIVVSAAQGGCGGKYNTTNTNPLGGNGGNGGGYTEGYVPFTAGVALPITVGLAGAAGAAGTSASSAGKPGGPGGSSSVGTALSATGGSSSGPGVGVGGLINRTGGLGRVDSWGSREG